MDQVGFWCERYTGNNYFVLDGESTSTHRKQDLPGHVVLDLGSFQQL